ncbi:MAG: ABC transporter substrate-binding protein [Armatimonadota bacterium]
MNRVRQAIAATVLAVAAAAGLALLAGCPPAQQQTGATVPPPEDLAARPMGEPYKIGALFAVTGPASSLGEPERDTAMMLEQQVNEAGGIHGRPIQVIVRDTRGEETEALTAAVELIERESVLAIIGPSRSGTTLAVIDRVEQAGVPLISCAAARAITDPVKRWVFQVAPGDRDAVFRIYSYVHEQGITRVAALTESGGFGVEGLKQLEAQAAEHGIEVVAKEEYGDTDPDMTAQLTRIAATDAQAVVCWGVGKAPALIAKNMAQLGMDIPLFQSHGVANKRFIEAAGDAANGVVMPAARLIVLDQLPADDPQLPVLRQYHEMFTARYGREPDHYGGHAWDALHIVVEAIRRAGPDADRSAVRDQIEQTEGFIGIGGIFAYSPEDHYGLSPEAFVMVRIEDGEWKLLE